MDLEHEKRLTEVEARSKSNSHRIDAVEDRQDKLDELVGSVKALATREEVVERDVKEIKEDVKTLATKPGKRWDSMVDKVIAAIIGAFVGYIMTKVGF